jgi:hypothetical protein
MNKAMSVVLVGMSLLITSCGSNLWDVGTQGNTIDKMEIINKSISNKGGNTVVYTINVVGPNNITWHSTNTTFDVGDELQFTLR